ncbi:hypothetical protein GCM10023196_032240 [Actinoallomurus vinaceus]|uniref:Uncharacterized protein n=1 Tax=Actinoallomurus vinaceus TaxID=1080074 RepID=A0ABP8UCH5_9ACTN
MVACAGIEWERPHSLVLSWARVTYRHYALRRVPGHEVADLEGTHVDYLAPVVRRYALQRDA